MTASYMASYMGQEQGAATWARHNGPGMATGSHIGQAQAHTSPPGRRRVATPLVEDALLPPGRRRHDQTELCSIHSCHVYAPN
jgi:hypothetical protein